MADSFAYVASSYQDMHKIFTNIFPTFIVARRRDKDYETTGMNTHTWKSAKKRQE